MQMWHTISGFTELFMEFHEVTFVRPVAQPSQAAGAQRVSGWVVAELVMSLSVACRQVGTPSVSSVKYQPLQSNFSWTFIFSCFYFLQMVPVDAVLAFKMMFTRTFTSSDESYEKKDLLKPARVC